MTTENMTKEIIDTTENMMKEIIKMIAENSTASNPFPQESFDWFWFDCVIYAITITCLFCCFKLVYNMLMTA